MKHIFLFVATLFIGHLSFGQSSNDFTYWEEKSDTFQQILLKKIHNETIMKLYKNNFNLKLKNVKDYNSFYGIFDVILKNRDNYLKPFYFYIVKGLDAPQFNEEAADLSRYFMQYLLSQTEYSFNYMQKYKQEKLFQKFIAFHYYPFDEKDNAGDPSWINFKSQITENVKNAPEGIKAFAQNYITQTDSTINVMKNDDKAGKTINLSN
jgi:hypothetical protein